MIKHACVHQVRNSIMRYVRMYVQKDTGAMIGRNTTQVYSTDLVWDIFHVVYACCCIRTCNMVCNLSLIGMINLRPGICGLNIKISELHVLCFAILFLSKPICMQSFYQILLVLRYFSEPGVYYGWHHPIVVLYVDQIGKGKNLH